ncbi:MAG: ribosome biogenesis GTP-binding protein YihA/YsxC [Ignavibacteria bacterium]|nr:ribosome biogenesis GTP-binding protein YihA/YsxC [Ignavibacteria bacterium]
MRVFDAEFIVGANSPEKFPKTNLPEFAFSGRSNVGKSSLLNTIVLRKNLAQVSSKPGRTRQINFYNIENKYIFADMPGFGYASVSKEERQTWVELNTKYFKGRENLVLVCLLVDSRIEPQKTDLAQIELLENLMKNYVIVLTKTDKVGENSLKKLIKEYEFLLQYCNFVVELLPFSAITRRGRDELIAIIKKFAEKWNQMKSK